MVAGRETVASRRLGDSQMTGIQRAKGSLDEFLSASRYTRADANASYDFVNSRSALAWCRGTVVVNAE